MSSGNDAPNLDRLRAEAVTLLRLNRPKAPPLAFYLGPLLAWIEERHIEMIRGDGFPEARRAFNPVFIHLPAEGCRLTELARAAGMSKQAMAELVEELLSLGYLARLPDPADGRAKIILRSQKGLEAHRATMRAFARIEAELREIVGAETMDTLRAALWAAGEAVRKSAGS